MNKIELLEQKPIEIDEEIQPMIKKLDDNLVNNFGIVDLSDRITFITLAIVSYKMNDFSLVGGYSFNIFKTSIEKEIEHAINKFKDIDEIIEAVLATFKSIKASKEPGKENIGAFIEKIIEISDLIDEMNWGYEDMMNELFEYFDNLAERIPA